MPTWIFINLGEINESRHLDSLRKKVLRATEQRTIVAHGATVGYFLTRLRRWNIGQGQFMRDFIKAKPELWNEDIGA